jgi:hypothetical protein
VADNLNRIKAIGFTRAGCWSLTNGSLGLELTAHENDRNVLYAFVVDGEPMYVGKTVQPLSKRMAGYRKPAETQSTNIKNNENMRRCLVQGKSVEIFVLPDTGLLHYGGFHVNLAAGLEDSLVRELAPNWNGGKKETAAGKLEPVEGQPIRSR